MKTNKIFKGLLALIVLMFFASSCDSYNVDLIENLVVSREFSPIGLTATVSNQTTVQLNWTVRENVDHYIVEFSADDPDFKTIFRTVEVAAGELPLKVTLEGETVYSIRVKAVSSTGLEDSKWSTVTATTLSEQLFLASIDGDIQALQAKVRWPANSSVTTLVANPGNITHVITAQEKIDGFATITGLTGETPYSVVLYNNTKIRGTITFTTLIDIGTGILVHPTDNLNNIVTNAADGAILVLQPGDYTVYSGMIALSKSVTIRGLYPYNKPLLHVNFSMLSGAANVQLKDLDLNGNSTLTDVVRYNSASYSYGPLLVSGCNIHDYNVSFIAGNASSSKVSSVVVDNSIVTNVNNTSSGDFIDFRNTYVANVTVKNSTFNNCSASRDFVRIDAVVPANGFSGTGLTSNVLIDACTLYNVSNYASGNKRILYVRFNANTSIVSNTLIAATSAIFSNQPTTTAPTYLNNNYFNAPSFIDSTIAANKYDSSGTYTTLDPGFVNAATANFKITNQTLLGNNVGDPRWRK